MTKTQTAEVEAIGLLESGFIWKVFYVCAALALLSIAISGAGRLLGRSIAMAGHTDDPTPAEIVIGNNVLAVPRNMIRFENARHAGVTTRLDLYMRWPDLGGYTDSARDDFNHAGDAPIVFATITERMMSRDMSGRFEPIYSQLTAPTGATEAGDLAVRTFTKASGYMNEVLLTAPLSGGQVYAVRCLDTAAAAQSLTPCERDIHLGDDLSVSYRFPRSLLADWKALDAAVASRVAGMIRTAR